MDEFSQLKQCLTIKCFKKNLEKNNVDIAVSEAYEIYVDITDELSSVKFKEDAESILEELMEIREILLDYKILNIIEVTIRNAKDKIDSLMYKTNPITKRIHILERHAPKCTKCDQKLIVREGNGAYFWGCKDFPKCWGRRYFTKEENEYILNGFLPNQKNIGIDEEVIDKTKTKVYTGSFIDIYNDIKSTYKDYLVIIENGCYFESLQEDAEYLSNTFGYKIFEQSYGVLKTGFPLESKQIWKDLLALGKPYIIVSQLKTQSGQNIDRIITEVSPSIKVS